MSDSTKGRDLLRRLAIPLVLTAAIWAAYGLDRLLPWDAWGSLGLAPRSTDRLWGIVGMPLIHGSWEHITANTPPLLVLSAFLVAVGRGWGTIGLIVLVNGALLWLVGRGSTVHGGASGLIFGLAGLLLRLGFVEKRFVAVAASLAVAFLYGPVIYHGVLPNQPGVSWDGHLTGAVAGLLVAGTARRRPAAVVQLPDADLTGPTHEG